MKTKQRIFYANGNKYSSIKALCLAHQLNYQTVYARFKVKDSFFLCDVFCTATAPARHEKERARALKQWRPSRAEAEYRRMVNAKPVPLLGIGHITHGINDRFGY